MTFGETILLSVSLAMDAFAVSIAAGIGYTHAGYRTAGRVAVSFGGFQTFMPLAGFFIAGAFYRFLWHLGHWVAFALLALIGGKMIYEAVRRSPCEIRTVDLGVHSLLFLALATSIDAFAAGVSLRFLRTSVIFPAVTIGVVTFILCFGGFLFGKRLGCAFGSRMEIAGGVILILLGCKFIAESLGG